jgi:hypothetical protein
MFGGQYAPKCPLGPDILRQACLAGRTLILNTACPASARKNTKRKLHEELKEKKHEHRIADGGTLMALPLACERFEYFSALLQRVRSIIKNSI